MESGSIHTIILLFCIHYHIIFCRYIVQYTLGDGKSVRQQSLYLYLYVHVHYTLDKAQRTKNHTLKFFCFFFRFGFKYIKHFIIIHCIRQVRENKIFCDLSFSQRRKKVFYFYFLSTKLTLTNILSIFIYTHRERVRSIM